MTHPYPGNGPDRRDTPATHELPAGADPTGETPYVYVLVRADIPFAQQAVQVGHAALEAGFRFEQPNKIANLILLSVPDEARLEAAARRLSLRGIAHHLFFEPDFGMGYSALATQPLLSKKDRQVLRKYPLFGVLSSPAS